MNSSLRATSVAAVLLGVAACAPVINSFNVQPGADVNLVNLRANINPGVAVSVDPPRLRVASLANNPPQFANIAGGFSSASGPNHVRDGIALPQGQFRFELTQPYQLIFSSTTQTVAATRDVTIAAPPGCFFFDGSAQGWTIDGFFELQTNAANPLGQRVNLCVGQTPTLRFDGRNFPQNYVSPIAAAFRSATVPINTIFNACLVNPNPVPQSGFVVVDLISPDLTNAAGWAGATGFEVQMRGINLSGANDPPIQAQLLLRQGADQFFRPVNAAGQSVFTNLTGGYALSSFVRPGTTLSQVRVRLFVPRLTSPPPETDINIDRVCPRTS